MTNKNEGTVITGTKVTLIASIIGILANGGLFAYSFYNMDSTKMAVFGCLGLLCVGFFLGSAIKSKQK